MEQRKAINVWFDRPGDFLEIFWGCDDGSGNNFEPDTEPFPTIFVNSSDYIVGFHVFGAARGRRGGFSETYTLERGLSHPLTIKYNSTIDLWDVQWGPGILDCVETPNPHIKAGVDARGDVQGVLISGLRTFDGEILNQDIYPVKPGAAAT